MMNSASPGKLAIAYPILIALAGIIIYGHLFWAHAQNISLISLLKLDNLVTTSQGEIFSSIRLPRFFVTFLTGAALSLAGLLVQRSTNNLLTAPSILGINSSASLAICASLFFLQDPPAWSILLFAFAGALVGGVLLFLMAFWIEAFHYPERFILAGVSLGLFYASLTQVVVLFDENNTQGLLYWLLGGVDGKNWTHVQTLLLTTLPCFVGSFFLERPLRALKLGDAAAQNLGHRPMQVRIISLLLAIILVAGSVATCGPIGFVGLIVPHIVGIWSGDLYHISLVKVGLFGGIFLILADLFSRLVNYPYETPVGIVSGILGACYFLYLSSSKK